MEETESKTYAYIITLPLSEYDAWIDMNMIHGDTWIVSTFVMRCISVLKDEERFCEFCTIFHPVHFIFAIYYNVLLVSLFLLLANLF